MNEIFPLFFTLKRLNTWLQSAVKDFDTIFHFKEAHHLVAEHAERFWHYFSLYGGIKRGCRALWKRMGEWPYSYDNEQK